MIYFAENSSKRLLSCHNTCLSGCNSYFYCRKTRRRKHRQLCLVRCIKCDFNILDFKTCYPNIKMMQGNSTYTYTSIHCRLVDYTNYNFNSTVFCDLVIKESFSTKVRFYFLVKQTERNSGLEEQAQHMELKELLQDTSTSQ